jgi:SAM-dependent methyltransferase
MLKILRCPACGSALRAEIATAEGEQIESGELGCSACEARYPIQGGIPDLVPPGVLEGAEWQAWKDHLATFEARRRDRRKRPNRLVYRLSRVRGTQPSFARFTGVTSGTVLDIGCGPGGLRQHFPAGVRYVGIDPLPVASVSEFPFARGIAEQIPFADATFSDITAISAIDHLKDVGAFCREATRVLVPGGRLHLVQTVHDLRNPIRAFAHFVKDALEDRVTRQAGVAGPHHMLEFTSRAQVRELLSEHFVEVRSREDYSDRWFSPSRLFLTLVPRAQRRS